MNTETMIAPAQLFVGKTVATYTATQELLRRCFCPHNGCSRCATCTQLQQQQYHATLWLTPENQYTLEMIEPIFRTIAFALAPNEQFFFIIQKADLLTAACANSLLKIVEEPPHGYHFIFLTERAQQVLPTIRSRCIITNLYTAQEVQNSSDLVTIFKTKLTCHPSVFLSLLAQEDRGEAYIQECLDELLVHWTAEEKKAISSPSASTAYSTGMLEIIKNSVRVPPMPGGSKLFWKNFYLQVKGLSFS